MSPGYWKPAWFFPGAAGSSTFGLPAPCQPLCVVLLGGGAVVFTLPAAYKFPSFNSFIFFFLRREHPSGNTDAFCGEAGSAAADMVSAPAAGWKRSSQHPQQRRGNAGELGLGEGLPEAAPAFDRVRMI